MSEASEILDGNAQAPEQAQQAQQGQAAQPKPQETDPKISSKLRVLMERESQALNRERLAKTQEERLKEKLLKIEQFEALQKDPTKIDDLLKHLGWDYDRLTQSKLQDGAVPPTVLIQQLRDEITDLKSKLQQEKDQEAESRKKQVLEAETKAVSDFRAEINDYIKNNASRYELIDFEDAHGLVYDVVDEYYERTIDPQTGVGKVMSIAEACDKVEQHLEKKYLAAKDKNKVKAFWNTIPKPIQEQLKKQETSQPPRTLTNNLGSKVQQKSTRPPEDQRIQAIVESHLAKMRSQYAG